MRIFQLIMLSLAAVIALGAIAISAYMNWIWGNTLSATPLYQAITGSIALVFDLLKAFLPLIAVVSISAGIAFSHSAKNIFMIFLSAASVWAAFLFLTSNRLDSFAQLNSQKSDGVEVRDDIKIKKAELASVGKTRPFVVVDADYQARCYTNKRRRWRSCKNLLKERGRALAAMDLKKELKDLKKNRTKIGVVGTTDGGLGNVSEVTGLSVKVLSNGQAFMTALLLEVLTGYVPSFIFAALFSLLALMKKEKAERLAQVRQAEPVLADCYVGLDFGSSDGDQTVSTVHKADGTFQTVGESSFVQQVIASGKAHEAIEERSALKAARLTNSPLDYFADRLMVRGGVAPLSSIAVHQDYRAWCNENGLDDLSYVAFTEGFSEYLRQILGAQAVDSQGNNATMGVQCVYRGIDVKPPEAAENGGEHGGQIAEQTVQNSTVVPIKTA